jgi:hypothetical protein
MSQWSRTDPVHRPNSKLLLGACIALCAAWSMAAQPVRAQISEPGHHAHYSVELEPHLVWQWTDNEAAYDDGVGLGFRASIPIMQDGPVPSINNNLALSFGMDWAHFGGDCRVFGYGGDCSEDDIWIPVTLQWNFFLTPSISIFPELGLGFRDALFDFNYDQCNGHNCRRSDLEVHLVMWFGARFRLTNQIALVLRLGTPSLQFGVSFNL